jgi:hypothetical protein
MESFALQQKLEDLNVILHEAIQKYPKSEKYILAYETIMCGIHAAAVVARGNRTRNIQDKLKYINEADLDLIKLKVLLRLALRIKTENSPILSSKKYGQIAAMLEEIGRMIGGWIKSATRG